MKTSKEFFERLQSDASFAKEVEEKAKAIIDTEEQDYKQFWIRIAKEYGYELTSEELDERYRAATSEMSEEELGKVAGGTTPWVVLTASLVFSGIASVKASIDSAKEGCI